MTWFHLGALVLATRFVANVVSRRARGRRDLRRGSGKQNLTFTGAVVYTVFVACLLAPMAASVFVPDAPFALAMRTWVDILSFGVWIMAVSTVVHVVLTIGGFPLWRRVDAVPDSRPQRKPQ